MVCYRGGSNPITSTVPVLLILWCELAFLTYPPLSFFFVVISCRRPRHVPFSAILLLLHCPFYSSFFDNSTGWERQKPQVYRGTTSAHPNNSQSSTPTIVLLRTTPQDAEQGLPSSLLLLGSTVTTTGL